MSPVPESVPLGAALGRVPAAPLMAPAALPACDLAAVDGYALRGLDALGAGAYAPVPLVLWRGPGALPPGHAFPVSAGAPLPEGCDAVLPLALAEEEDGLIQATQAVAPGENLLRCGADLAQGAPLLQAGRALWPQDLAVLAVCGIAAVQVLRRPRVRVVLVGNEWCSPGGGAVREANAVMLSALLRRDGGEPVETLTVADDRAAIGPALAAPGVDLVLAVGGTGAGAEDATAAAMADVGEVALHGIALEPATSTGLGTAGGVPVLLLPGPPSACQAAYDGLAVRLLRRQAGLPGPWPYATFRARLTRKASSSLGVAEYCRVRLADGGASPLRQGGALAVAGLAAADGFVLIGADCEGYAAGSEVDIYLYGQHQHA